MLRIANDRSKKGYYTWNKNESTLKNVAVHCFEMLFHTNPDGLISVRR